MKFRWLVILLLVLSTAGCGLEVGATETRLGIIEGTVAPDFELATLAGGRDSLYRYRGQPVVINFFATWCGPCMAEMPAIENVYRNYHQKGLAILAVDLDEAPDVVAHMRDEQRLSFPLLLDKGKQISNSYRANSIPRTFYIDANGVIRKVTIGSQEESEITAAVTELFKYEYRIPTEPPQATQQPGQPNAKAENEKGATGCVNIKSALVRSGPGSSHKVITQMAYQTCVRFDARSADGAWLRLSHKDSGGMRLWVTTGYVDLQGDANALPVGE